MGRGSYYRRHYKMTQYTCHRDFSAKGVNFKIGQKINSTEYIALDAKYRANFTKDFKPLKKRR